MKRTPEWCGLYGFCNALTEKNLSEDCKWCKNCEFKLKKKFGNYKLDL